MFSLWILIFFLSHSPVSFISKIPEQTNGQKKNKTATTSNYNSWRREMQSHSSVLCWFFCVKQIYIYFFFVWKEKLTKILVRKPSLSSRLSNVCSVYLLERILLAQGFSASMLTDDISMNIWCEHKFDNWSINDVAIKVK